MRNLSIWDHIDDLRDLIIQMALIILLGFALVFYFHQNILNVLIHNWQTTSSTELSEEEIKYKRIFNSSSKTRQVTLPAHAQILEKQNSHKKSENSNLYQIKSQGYIEYSLVENPKLLLLSPLEGLVQVFKISFWLSFALTSPIWSWAFFRFILPGLHSHEKKLFIPFIFFSMVCAGLAIFFAHFFTIPLANQYLTTFNSGIGQNAWTFAHYIDYTFVIYFGHIIACELCLFLFFMVQFRIISSEKLISLRRYVIVLSFILAAILTPPDILTQFALAIPLVGFYEIAIFYGKYRKN